MTQQTTGTWRRGARVLALGVSSWLFAAALCAQLTGPIEGGTQGQPFNAPPFDLEPYGYVAEEYFLEGTAHAYRLKDGGEHSADGAWSTERDASDSQPFKIRLLIVRPKDAASFNGTVMVHWQNVTAGYELGAVDEGELIRGYAWVGVSAQKIGVHGFPGPSAAGLEQWDPERYGELQHPGDAYSYDIFTQAARTVAPDRTGTPDVMGGLPVKRLIASGASQSASRLRTYINGVHAHTKVFDAYLPYIDFANPVPFARDKQPRTDPRRRGARTPTVIRADLDVPVFVVNSETEVQAYHPARQPDGDRFRLWEVAGTAHVSAVRGQAAPGLDQPNWLSYRPVYDAALRHLHVWLKDGIAPPKLPRIAASSSGGRVEVERDADGNAKAGIRLPEMEAPTAVHTGIGTAVEGGNRFAFLYGHSRDFSAEQLKKRYPSAGAYLKLHDPAVGRAVDAGFLLEEDAQRLREEARAWAEKALR